MRRLVDPYTARLPIPDARHAGRGILSDRGENGQETTAAEEMPTQIGKARKRWRPGGRRLATSSRAITPLQNPRPAMDLCRSQCQGAERGFPTGEAGAGDGSAGLGVASEAGDRGGPVALTAELGGGRARETARRISAP